MNPDLAFTLLMIGYVLIAGLIVVYAIRAANSNDPASRRPERPRPLS